MQNPFTTTFSKTPEQTYIATDKLDEILENFSYDSPSESVYKITGVRGSGKTVILAKVEEEMRKNPFQEKGWLVLDLNPTRDMLVQLAAKLQAEGFGKRDTKKKTFSINASVLGSGGGFGYSMEKDALLHDIGVEIDTMLEQVASEGKKVLVGIDEVSKTKEMIQFASEYGRWLRAGYPVYLVCTGLYENIEEVSNVKNLTFFRRATTIKTGALNLVRMSEMYKRKLTIETEQARMLAKTTKGYAYAFQELGVLCFKHGMQDIETILDELKSELYAYSYEKIWEEMTETDRFLVSLLVEKEEYKREEVLNLMGERAGSYSMYRDRLNKRGILNTRQGYISFALPFFADYIKEYHH